MPPRCFSFPILEKKEIAKHLSELAIRANVDRSQAALLSVDNLISPSPETLIPVYDFLSSYLSSYEYRSREESQQPGFEAMQMLGDYPNLHQDSYPLLVSMKRIQKFMTAAGAEDFSVPNDLYRPEPQRTIVFLSAAINYIMHSICKLEFIAQLCQARDEAIAKLEEMKEEKFKMESEIAQIEQERAAERPQVEAIEMETKELNTKIQALNKQQHGLQRNINNLKQEDVRILDEISNLDFEIMQRQQEGARIRSQLVENPQEMQKMLQEKKLALIEEEAQLRKAAERCETLKAKIEIKTKGEKKLLKLQKLLQALEEQNTARNAADKVLKERKARLKALEKEEWSLDAKMEELDWGVRRLEEQSEKLSKQCNDASKELQALKVRKEQQRIDHEARNLALDEKEKEIEALERMDAEFLADKESKILRLRAAANKLLEAVSKMHTPAA